MPGCLYEGLFNTNGAKWQSSIPSSGKEYSPGGVIGTEQHNKPYGFSHSDRGWLICGLRKKRYSSSWVLEMFGHKENVISKKTIVTVIFK